MYNSMYITKFSADFYNSYTTVDTRHMSSLNMMHGVETGSIPLELTVVLAKVSFPHYGPIL